MRFQAILPPFALFRLVLLVFPFLVVGAPFSFAKTVSEVSAKAELEKALHRYQNVSVLDVHFLQLKTLKEMKHPLRSKGHLTVRPPASVIYHITEPSELAVTLTPQFIKIESGTEPNKTVQTLPVADLKGSKEQQSLQAMVAWLKMDPVELGQDYEITKAGELAFQFAPHAGAGAPFSSLKMTLSPNDEVKSLVMNESSGDQIEFLFDAPTVKYKK